MQRIRLSVASSCIVATAVLIALASGTSAGAAAGSKLAEAPGQIDIELAFDTTSSMGPAIEQAKRDGVSIVAGVREAFPDAQFAVVSFRDYGNPRGDYEVLQPMTGDIGAVQAGLSQLRLASNPSPLNTSAEEYNLVLYRSYTDPLIGWRSAARKVVVVIGDAQPHAAGTSGIAGCTDKSVDHYGLNTTNVLAGMRAAQRTLLMIRQISPETSVSLSCYEAMAQGAYAGGAARNGGDADLAGPIVALTRSAIAPVTMRPDIGLALPGGSAGYTAAVSNPNRFTLRLRSLTVTLPRGFRYRSGPSTAVLSSTAAGATTVSWPIERALRPSEKVSVHFRASVPRRRGRYGAEAVFRLQLPGGHAIPSSGRASLRVTRRLQRLVVAARGRTGNASLRGSVQIAFRPGVRPLATRRLVAGRLVIRRGPGRSIALRARSSRIVAFGSPTVLRLDLKVVGVAGTPACSPGARGSALIIDDQHFRPNGLTWDRVVTRFGAKCRIATGRWSNGRSTARASVSATAR